MAPRTENLTDGLREALRLATKLRRELPTNQLAAIDVKLLDELLRFDLAVVFAHLLGRQPPDAPDKIMTSSASFAHGIHRILDVAKTTTCFAKPPVRFAVGNVWRWRGPRRFEVALADDRENDRARWKQNWDHYSELTKLAAAQKPPLFTWNELLSQGIRFRRPMGLVLGSPRTTEAAGVFFLTRGPLMAGYELRDQPYEDSVEQALASLSSLGSDTKLSGEGDSAINRLSMIAGKSSEEKGVDEVFCETMEDLTANKVHPTHLELCKRIFWEFGIVLNLEGVAFMFRALQRYYLEPWNARAFYSFPDPMLIRAGERNLTSVLSVGLTANGLAEKHLWMLELIAWKILGPYLHLEIQQFFSRKDLAARQLALENRLSSPWSIYHAAATAKAEINERSMTIIVGNICLPMQTLASVHRRYPNDRPENRLIGRFIVAGGFGNLFE